MIRRTLRYEVVSDHDGETRWTDVEVEVEDTATPFLTADRLVEDPYHVVHAEWVETPGQASLLEAS